MILKMQRLQKCKLIFAQFCRNFLADETFAKILKNFAGFNKFVH